MTCSNAAATIAFPSHAAAGFVLVAEDGMAHTLIEHTLNAQLRLAQIAHGRAVLHRWRCVYSDNAARIVEDLHNRFAAKRLSGTLDYFVIDYAVVYHDLLAFDCEQADIMCSGDLVVGTLCRFSTDDDPRPKLFEITAFSLKGTMRMARIVPCGQFGLLMKPLRPNKLPHGEHPIMEIHYDVPADVLIRVPQPARETA